MLLEQGRRGIHVVVDRIDRTSVGQRWRVSVVARRMVESVQVVRGACLAEVVQHGRRALAQDVIVVQRLEVGLG